MAKAKTKAALRSEERMQKQRQKDYPEAFIMLSNIDALCDAYGYTDADLCRAMGKTDDTLRKRRKQPDTFTEREITLIARMFGKTVAQLHVAPTYESPELVI